MATRKKATRQPKKSLEDELEAYADIPTDESRTVFFVGDVTEELVKTTTEKMVHLAEKDATKPITLVINTYGGSVYDAFMLYDLIKYLPTPVHTVGLGKIMSAGCLLLAAGNHRRMGQNATLMYHAGWDSAEGTVWQMKNDLKEAERVSKRYDELFAAETGMTLKEVEKLYNSRGPTADHYLTADATLEKGIVDELI